MTRGWPASLSAGRVGVRPLRRRDSRRWARLRADSVDWLRRWEATLPPEGGPPSTSYVAMTAAMRRRARRGEALPFVITWDGEMVGQITVNGIVWGSARSANIGYWIAGAYAGRGITPTALALVCDHLFGTVELHRVDIAIRPDNAASLRVAEKLGFERVGYATRYLHINGEWHDHVLFQILREDVTTTVMDRLGQSSHPSHP